MQKKVIISLLITMFAQATFGIKAYFYQAPFYAPNIGPYIETYLAIMPNTVTYKINNNNKLQASVEVTIIFSSNDTVKEFRKYNISSPEVDTSMTNIPQAFIDQQRIPLSTGSYKLQLTIKDNNSTDTIAFTHNDTVNVPKFADEVSISGIEPTERFKPTDKETKYTKSGYEIIPYISNFYPTTIDVLTFYCELYNIDKSVGADNDYLIRYQVTSIPSRRTFEKTTSFEKRKATPISVITKSINIKDLPSGNYNLEMEVRNKNNDLILTKNHFFQRSNNIEVDAPTDYLDIITEGSWVEKYSVVHELAAHIKSLHPISELTERNFIESDFSAKDLKIMQQFFINFWEARNTNAPEKEWEIYQKQVELVDKLYGTQIKKGYMTDRGRVYLQYGTPNQIIKRKNMSFFQPYEIWHYQKINDKSNRRFVFCLNDIGVNEYDLVHSDMPGEIAVKAWIDIVKGNHLIDSGNNNVFEDEYNQLRSDYRD